MKFTVIIPTFNNGVVVRSAIESILEQTVSDFEIFVVADGAPKETHDLVKQMGAKDKRVRLFQYAKGERHGEAWRHEALKHADSEAVAYLSDDDFWFPDHLETLTNLLKKADFAHTRHAAISPEFEIQHMGEQLTDPRVRERMLREKVNIFNFSVPGHRLDAYRRLPVGWSPAPRDLWTDLHMWRKWLAMDGVRYAASPLITTLHFSRGQRMQAKTAAEPEVWFWREFFRDPSIRIALRGLTTQGSQPVPMTAVVAAARKLGDPSSEITQRLLRQLTAANDELARMRATATWRYTQPLRNVWAKIRAGGAKPN
jgi:GalNAc5-diNAcBac-PP-undecaprenol beta-1,3-glucosyltransferase